MCVCVCVCVCTELEQKLQEEHASKLRVENKLLELEKHSSMLDCDYKQALQKLDELRRHKDKLTEEVRVCVCVKFVMCLYLTYGPVGVHESTCVHAKHTFMVGHVYANLH